MNKLNKLNNEYVRKACENFNAHHFNYDGGYGFKPTELFEMGFNNPSKTCGYGAVLITLDNVSTPMTRPQVQIKLHRPTTSAVTTFQFLMAAKLIERAKGGYVITKLGHDYVKAWLAA